ncbi:carbon-nitrogen hydrolase family protein [Rhizobium alvei]|uniref:Carbon-nitrogen hydrolase family protein n=1 Tax=Rhizobium alvei TaxID=1132659 RepID=A0ABT8YS85_9HYPH|nr:carbon-nitrogen hydrolase family protein [Rhizobium alvei]MDO6966612.1 carbon-nitrogen hydrolase family protein [Rhizobium alvei]
MAGLQARESERFLVAGVQMPISYRQDNIPSMCAKVAETMALFPGTDMIVFSELAMHGPLETQISPDPSKDIAQFQHLAEKHGVWIVPGSMYVRREDKIFNHAVVIGPDGSIQGRYDKIFPFQPFETGVSAGASVLAFDVPGVGRFGLSICYDIWFPEIMRALTSEGVEVLIHPTLTGTTDRAAENAISKATAAMFQCYVVDVNGLDGGGNGRSLVADPSGNAAYQAGQVAEIFPVMLDLGLVRQARRDGANGLGQVLKSWRDREIDFDVYRPGQRSAYLDSLGPLEPMKKRNS